MSTKFQLWALCSNMRKHEVTNIGVNSSSRSIIGYRFAVTKEEAIGAFVLQTQEKYPQYDLGEVVVVEIPEDQLVHHVEQEHPDVSGAETQKGIQKLLDFSKDVANAAFGPDKSAGKNAAQILEQINAYRGMALQKNTTATELTAARAWDDTIIDKARRLLLILRTNMLPEPHTAAYVNYSAAVTDLETSLCRKFPAFASTIAEEMRKGMPSSTRVFRDLNAGEEIQVGDEYCSVSDGKWYPVMLASVGLPYRPHPKEEGAEHHSPHRRQLKS